MRPRNMRGGILVQCASEVVDFQYYTHIAEEKQDIQVQRLCYWKISRKETETALQRPSIGLTGSSTERMSANTWSHATPTRHSGFINTFPCYFSWEILAFSSTWRSHQSHMIFTRIPWTSFACEEQSLFLFYGLISIKPCCWLGTSCTVFENQYRMDNAEKLNPTELGLNEIIF